MENSDAKQPQDLPVVPLPILAVTMFFSGALIMVIEVMGSRVVSPFFGVGIFVWTSLIAVTMIALATGYAYGGHLSDRKPHPDMLYLLIMVSGILSLLVPVLKNPVMQLCMSLGLRGGAFLSSMILFFPPLFFLGCVSPYVIRLAAREFNRLGKTVGTFYALSTVGSVAGTVITGFFLIAFLGVSQIFFVTGALLLSLGGIYFLAFRRRWKPATLLLLLLFFWPGSQTVDKVMDNGTRVTRVHKQDTYYGSVQVVDYRYGPKHIREMVIDGLVQGGVDMPSGQSYYPYAYLLGWYPSTIRPGGEKCLVIGVGAGIIPPLYVRQGVEVDVVDIDPVVIETARNYFGFHTNGETHLMDARYFLHTTQQHYDYLLLDVFNGDTTPGHLLSTEAFALMKSRLTDSGVLAINLVGDLKENTLMTASVVGTLRQHFKNVDLYPNFDPNKESSGNISVFAYDGQAFPAPMQPVMKGWVHPASMSVVSSAQRWQFKFDQDVEWLLLTDDYNPIDLFDLYLKEKVRKDIISTTDWDILTSS